MSGSLRALLIVLGVIMLLPGFCALVFAVVLRTEDFPGLWAFCFFVSFLGLLILYAAVRRASP
jgi:hypothetical protein